METLTHVVRGLLGIDVDVPARRVTIAPHLPPDWETVAVDNVPVGTGLMSFELRRTAGRITASVTRSGDTAPIEVVFSPALPLGARVSVAGAVSQPTPGDLHVTVKAMAGATAALSVSYSGGFSIVPPSMPAIIGHRSEAPRVLSERLDAEGRYVVSLEGIAGRTYPFRVRTPDTGAERVVMVAFPTAGANADGYVGTTVSFGSQQQVR